MGVSAEGGAGPPEKGLARMGRDIPSGDAVSMTSWAEGGEVLISVTRGLVCARRQRVRTKSDSTRIDTLAWSRAISVPGYGRHATLLATTASGGFKYE